MRKWYIIDDRTTARASVFEDALNITTKEEAFKEAVKAWGRLTKAEQMAADAFGVCTMEQDEDGNPDYETMNDWVNVKGAV